MISVIVPVYNRAHFIVECLESVFAQTYRDFEVIVVDDGSTDNLVDTLAPYRDRIRYVRKTNGGAASARNEGVRNVRGKYVAWLDSDDRWLPFKLELEVKLLEALPKEIAFIYTDFSCRDEQTQQFYQSYMREYCFTMGTYGLTIDNMFSHHSKMKELGVSIETYAEDPVVSWGPLFDKAILGYLALTSTILLKKEWIDRTGLFDETFETSEDYFFHARIMKLAPVAFVDVSSIIYRRFHADQLSGEKMELTTSFAWLRVLTELAVNDTAYYNSHRRLVDTRLAHSHYAIGRAYFKRRQYANAVRHFKASIAKRPMQRKIYFYFFMSIVLNLLKAGYISHE